MERENDYVWFYVVLQFVQHVMFAIFNCLFPLLNAWWDPGIVLFWWESKNKLILYGFCWINQLFLNIGLQDVMLYKLFFLLLA